MKEYFTNRLNRIIVDYLLREDFIGSANKFIEENNLKVSYL